MAYSRERHALPFPALLFTAASDIALPGPSSLSNQNPVALITGGSSGLGLVIAQTFLNDGYRVAIVGRSAERLDQAAQQIVSATSKNAASQTVKTFPADLGVKGDAEKLANQVRNEFGRLDVLVNVIGASDRGLASELTAEKMHELIQFNVVTMLHCSQAMLPMLQETQGSIVNIGSLAGKVGARYLGGYNAAKHALTGVTQQMRLELSEQGVHVGLVSPGPIRRADAGTRYNDRVDGSVPAKAAAPGGGTKVKGLAPEKVAQAVLRCAQRRKPDVVLPGYLRLLITIGHASPRLGDWLLRKFT